jgi:hypothetical protein
MVDREAVTVYLESRHVELLRASAKLNDRTLSAEVRRLLVLAMKDWPRFA